MIDLFDVDTNKTALSALCDITINNFTTPYVGAITFGTNPVFGDVCILRDGLIMTHAALYDPSLLKEKERQILIVR